MECFIVAPLQDVVPGFGGIAGPHERRTAGGVEDGGGPQRPQERRSGSSSDSQAEHRPGQSQDRTGLTRSRPAVSIAGGRWSSPSQAAGRGFRPACPGRGSASDSGSKGTFASALRPPPIDIRGRARESSSHPRRGRRTRPSVWRWSPGRRPWPCPAPPRACHREHPYNTG